MRSFNEKVVWLVERLRKHGIPFAVGGAIALGYYTRDPRGTRDIDINIFVTSDTLDLVAAALSPNVAISDDQRMRILRDDQVRLRWDDVPVDLFFSSIPLHSAMLKRINCESFDGVELPILSVTDIVICKSIFAREKDWVDIKTVLGHPALDKHEVDYWVEDVCGSGSSQLRKWRNVSSKRRAAPEDEMHMPTMRQTHERTKYSTAHRDGDSVQLGDSAFDDE